MLATVHEGLYGPRETPEWIAAASYDGGEQEAVEAAFGDDLESIHDVLYTLE